MKNKRKLIQIITLVFLSVALTTGIFLSPIISRFVCDLMLKGGIVQDNASLGIHFLDVGQGDAIAIHLPDGKSMLIDSGKASYAKRVSDFLLENLVAYHSDMVIDYLVMTHSDNDHIGGMISIMNSFDIKNIYRPAMPSIHDDDYSQLNALANDTYNETIARVNQLALSGTNVFYNLAGIKIEGVDYQIEFLYPENQNYSTTNDYSAVVLLTYRGKSFLFTGDINESIEQDLLARYPQLDVDVLKVSHHGASGATCLDFVTAITPEYAVISVGENDYGHPTAQTLANLMSTCDRSNILSTQQCGVVSFVLGERYDFLCLTGGIKTAPKLDWWVYALLFILLDSLVIYALVKTSLASSTKTDKHT